MKYASTWIAGGLLCSALSGCVTVTGSVQNYMDDMIYSAKCVGTNDTEACKAKAKEDFDNSQQGRNENSALQTSSLDSPDVCKTIETTGPSDVDTAYIRAMKKFRFTTQEELDSRQRYKKGIVNPRFKHVRTPGVMYDLWDFVDIPGFSGIRPTAGLQLSKASSKGTSLEAKYCLGNNDPAVSNQAFWDAADKAFRSLVM